MNACLTYIKEQIACSTLLLCLTYITFHKLTFSNSNITGLFFAIYSFMYVRHNRRVEQTNYSFMYVRHTFIAQQKQQQQQQTTNPPGSTCHSRTAARWVYGHLLLLIQGGDPSRYSSFNGRHSDWSKALCTGPSHAPPSCSHSSGINSIEQLSHMIWLPATDSSQLPESTIRNDVMLKIVLHCSFHCYFHLGSWYYLPDINWSYMRENNSEKSGEIRSSALRHF